MAKNDVLKEVAAETVSEQTTINEELKIEKLAAEAEENFKKYLADQPKTQITIPIDPLNPNEPQIVGINGVIYSIPRGKTVEVPQPIATVWLESYNATILANQRAKIVNMGGNVEVL